VLLPQRELLRNLLRKVGGRAKSTDGILKFCTKLMSAGGVMPNISLDVTSISILALLNLAVYGVIMVVFIKAGQKYKGGIVGKSIQFLIATIGFFLLADIALVLIPVSGLQVGYTLHLVLKVCALTCLAIGGLNFFAK